ncbi:methyltransferase domain protein [Acetobacteraceae bacterium AT-5844]|nr:methyltransferase domain protein [Acetobacteraceae bacterium AT-5844]
MPFPTDDRAWNDTLLYLLERRRPGERTLAPDQFVDELPFVRTYGQPKGEDEPADAWMVIHKGMLSKFDLSFLDELPKVSVPVFANEVFVVFAREPGADVQDLSDSNHVKSLFGQLPQLRAERGEPAAAAEAGADPQAEAEAPVIEPIPSPEPAQAPAAPAPAPSGPGGRAVHRLRQDELQHLMAEYLGDVSRRRVVDLGCGSGRFSEVLASAEVLGIDKAPDVIESARRAHAAQPNFRFINADPRQPELDEPPFDIALLADALVQPGSAASALLESAAALLKTGGLLFVSVDNKLALNRLVAREEQPSGFTYGELASAVRAAGFRVLRADGFVLPWPEGPGTEDEVVLEAMRELGRLAGPAYAQSMVLLARKG